MKKIIAAALVATMLVGCATTGTVTSVFDPDEAAFIKKQGSGTITGQAFLRRNDGVVVYAAGSEVDLIPQTTYSGERMLKIYGAGGRFSYTGMNFTNSDPRYEQYVRKTVANGEGRFTFDHVAPGNYYVVTNVIWMAGYARQGGALMTPVTITGSETAEVILNGQ